MAVVEWTVAVKGQRIIWHSRENIVDTRHESYSLLFWRIHCCVRRRGADSSCHFTCSLFSFLIFAVCYHKLNWWESNSRCFTGIVTSYFVMVLSYCKDATSSEKDLSTLPPSLFRRIFLGNATLVMMNKSSLVSWKTEEENAIVWMSVILQWSSCATNFCMFYSFINCNLILMSY